MDVAWGLLLFLGVVLRLRQYFFNRSLWADEASLAVNLVHRNFRELTQLLDYQQAAPIGFLYIEKLLLLILGNRDYILRLFPLFSGILAVYLIYRIARTHVGNAGMFAVLMFSISGGMVYYTSELKQYMSDAMIALLLVWLASNCLKEDAGLREFLFLGLAGTLAIWVSHPSVFTLAGIGLVLFLKKVTQKIKIPFLWIAGIGFAWFASFGIEYLVSLRNIVADGYLIEYWSKAYMPLPIWDNLDWFLRALRSFLVISLHTDKTMILIFIGLSIIGSLSLFIRNRDVAFLLTMPVLITAVVSAFQKYPFTQRFILFLVPFAFLLMAEGVRAVFWLAAKWNRALAFMISGIPVAITLWFIVPIAYWNFVQPLNGSEIKPVLQYVGEHRLPDDIVYVYHSADPAFNYYAPFYGLEQGNILIGFETTRKKLALRHFYEDVDALRGNERVWFIFSDIVDCGGCDGSMQQFYVDYLDGFGTVMDTFYATGANAYLYDIKP